MERSERGFTLVEVVIGVAIVATTAAAGIAISLAARPAATSAAAARFDALLDAARTEARAFNSGVTIAFTPLEADPAIDGFRARLYRNRPAVGALVALNLPEIGASVALRESEALGAPSFALTIHHDGRIAGVAGYIPAGASSSPETSCPASGSYHLTFTAPGGHADRYIPCRITLAATGPVAYATIPPANTNSPPPTNGCSGGPCSNSPPAQTSTCPPNSFLNGTACIDSPLVVSPSSLLFLHSNSAPQSIVASESSYLGPIRLTSTTCNRSAVTISGGGNGPSTSFTATSSQAGTCSFSIGDDHGSSQTIPVTTYGNLIVSPTLLAFTSSSAPPQTITAHEDYYSGVISADLTTPDNAGNPGCSSYSSIDSSARNTDSSWAASFLLSPLSPKEMCAVTLRDDHGGASQIAVTINLATATCPNGIVVSAGTPCAKTVLLSGHATPSMLSVNQLRCTNPNPDTCPTSTSGASFDTILTVKLPIAPTSPANAATLAISNFSLDSGNCSGSTAQVIESGITWNSWTTNGAPANPTQQFFSPNDGNYYAGQQLRGNETIEWYSPAATTTLNIIFEVTACEAGPPTLGGTQNTAKASFDYVFTQ